MTMQRLLNRAAAGYPWPVDTSLELTRALRFLGVDRDLSAETVVRAGYVLGGVIGTIAAAVVGLIGLGLPAIGLTAILGGLGTTHLVHSGPVALATLARTRALGAAPGIVGRAVLRMRIEPSEEAAVAFAADTGESPLASSLRRHVRRAAGRPGTGIDTFGEEWRPWFPALERALHLLGAAADAPPARRERTLDRALETVLRGTSDQMQAFVGTVSGPATGIYAFGVLLPLALVAVVPGARMAGIDITVSTIVVIYDVLLPAGLIGAAGWLLLRRPVAFPAPTVTRAHPSVSDRRWPAPVGGVLAGGGAAVLGANVIAPWTAPLAGLGIGSGVALAVWYRPIMAVRNRVRDIEDGLPDALYLIGRRVSGGHSVEQGIERAGAELPGAIGDVLTEATRRQRVLSIGVGDALIGDHGVVSTLPSARTQSMATLLALAGQEGQPAGHAIVSMADHLNELQTVEREAHHELAQVTGTLKNTAAVFGPLVAGATVALADGLRTLGDDEAVATLPVDGLGLAIGTYVLILATVLVILSTTLEQGLDRPAIGYRIGIATVSATTTFLIAYVGAGLLI